MRKLEPFPALLLLIGLFVLLVRVLAGCSAAGSPEAKAGVYEAELVACNRTATSLCKSILCENDSRARHGRPPRELPASCVDGGVP